MEVARVMFVADGEDEVAVCVEDDVSRSRQEGLDQRVVPVGLESFAEVIIASRHD